MNNNCTLLLFVICLIFIFNVESKQISNLKHKINAHLLVQRLDNNTLNESFAYLDKCDNNTCRSKNGICDGEHICICKSQFANFNLNLNNNTNNFTNNSACNYERKKSSIALTLELLLPFGFSYFYLGKNNMGILKISLFAVLPLIFLFLFCYCCTSDNSKHGSYNKFIFYFFLVLYWISFFSWLMMDVILIATDKVTDNNGVKLFTNFG